MTTNSLIVIPLLTVKCEGFKTVEVNKTSREEAAETKMREKKNR